MTVTTKDYDWSRTDYGKKPEFLTQYERNRNRCALSAEQIINRALILGFTCTPFEDPFYPTCKWFASRTPNGGRYVGETIEMCAFRWLLEAYPEVLLCPNGATAG